MSLSGSLLPIRCQFSYHSLVTVYDPRVEQKGLCWQLAHVGCAVNPCLVPSPTHTFMVWCLSEQRTCSTSSHVPCSSSSWGQETKQNSEPKAEAVSSVPCREGLCSVRGQQDSEMATVPKEVTKALR